MDLHETLKVQVVAQMRRRGIAATAGTNQDLRLIGMWLVVSCRVLLTGGVPNNKTTRLLHFDASRTNPASRGIQGWQVPDMGTTPTYLRAVPSDDKLPVLTYSLTYIFGVNWVVRVKDQASTSYPSIALHTCVGSIRTPR